MLCRLWIVQYLYIAFDIGVPNTYPLDTDLSVG